MTAARRRARLRRCGLMVALGNMVETTVVVKKFGRVVGGREGYLNPEGEGTAAGRIWRETGGRGGLSIFPGKPCMGQRQPLTFN